MSLTDAVVVVAGAGGGAGTAVVRRLSAAGAIVVIADRSLDFTEALVREIGEAGGQIDAYASRLARRSDHEGMGRLGHRSVRSS